MSALTLAGGLLASCRIKSNPANSKILTPTNLRSEYRVDPIGTDVMQPRLSWIPVSGVRGHQQSAYQILVADDAARLSIGYGNCWNSGQVKSDATAQIEYAGVPLKSGQSYWWKVRLWDQDGNVSAYSDPAMWKMGLLAASEWRGEWISYATAPDAGLDLPPCAYLRQRFEIGSGIKQATLYITAKGVYEAHLNGKRIGDAVFAPGWTDYQTRLQYQTYDVTHDLMQGANALGIVLGDGWYAGSILGERGRYGDTPQVKAHLEIKLNDGQTTIIGTDKTWSASTGPIRYSDIFEGEYYDARLDIDGWTLPDFNPDGWEQVRSEDDDDVMLEANKSEPIRITQQIASIAITEPQAGVFVFDLGQNMVGWVRMQVQGERGTKIRLRHAEVLNPDGTIFTDSLRTADATDIYVLKGGEPEGFEPHFTYHGFRYVEVTGYPGTPDLSAITGQVIHSDLTETGFFECSDPTINQIWRNIQWGQRGNFFGIPTDCPQRDERLGWLGDIGVFARTSTFNMDTAAFYTRWMHDIRDAQHPDGAFTDFAPYLSEPQAGSPGWADVGIILPATLYRVYGDRRIIEQSYESMQRFMGWLSKTNPYFVRDQALGANYSDWSTTEIRKTSGALLATAYWALCARLMSEMALAIGRSHDADQYTMLYKQIGAAFMDAYVWPDGQVEGSTQTGYALALALNLVPDDGREAAIGHLLDTLRDPQGMYLRTGFIGTHWLPYVLTDAGHPELAYQLLHNEGMPSWGYMVRMGATTIWENWNSVIQGADAGGIPTLNSLNHFALGSIGEWLFTTVAGIDLDPIIPAYKRIVIHPRVGGGLSAAKAEYQSIRGRILSHWTLQDNVMTLIVSIPANTTALVHLPVDDPANVNEGDRLASEADQVRYIGQVRGNVVFEIGSGDYTFTIRDPRVIALP